MKRCDQTAITSLSYVTWLVIWFQNVFLMFSSLIVFKICLLKHNTYTYHKGDFSAVFPFKLIVPSNILGRFESSNSYTFYWLDQCTLAHGFNSSRLFRSCTRGIQKYFCRISMIQRKPVFLRFVNGDLLIVQINLPLLMTNSTYLLGMKLAMFLTMHCGFKNLPIFVAGHFTSAK